MEDLGISYDSDLRSQDSLYNLVQTEHYKNMLVIFFKTPANLIIFLNFSMLFSCIIKNALSATQSSE
jgi:hypothetical protein